VYSGLKVICLRFQVLMAMSLKMSVFWDVAPCSLVEIDVLDLLTHRPYRGSKHLWNIGQFLPDYTVQHPRRQSSWKWSVHEVAEIRENHSRAVCLNWWSIDCWQFGILYACVYILVCINKLTPWSKVILDNLIVTQLV
jgi:hypothetical protein